MKKLGKSHGKRKKKNDSCALGERVSSKRGRGGKPYSKKQTERRGGANQEEK